MPSYDYRCEPCDLIEEIFHSMSDDTPRNCSECGKTMEKLIGMGYFASKGFKPTREDYKQSEHTKKVKDFERAVRMRKKMFGKDSVGDPNDTPDPKHIIKRGRTKGGGNIEVDKKAFIHECANNPMMLDTAKQALKKARSKPKK